MNSEAKTLATLGARLKRSRVQLGLTQAQVAERAGFDPQYYNRIERGKVNVTFLTLQRIAAALACDPLPRPVRRASAATRLDRN